MSAAEGLGVMQTLAKGRVEVFFDTLTNWDMSKEEFLAGYRQAEKDLMADAIETTIDGKVVKVIVIDEWAIGETLKREQVKESVNY